MAFCSGSPICEAPPRRAAAAAAAAGTGRRPRSQRACAADARISPSADRRFDTPTVVRLTRRVFADDVDEHAAFFRRRLADRARRRADGSLDRTTTYGELDLELFLTLLRAANPQPGETFLDLGCGVGRLVVAAQLDFQHWSRCRGVELLPELVDEAREYLGAARARLSAEAPAACTFVQRCEIFQGDLQERPELLREAHVVTMYATTWGDDPFQRDLTRLSERLGRQLRDGARVIVVDKTLCEAHGFRLLTEITRANGDTGESTAWIYVKRTSA